MLRVAIVDDEAHAREGLRLRLRGCENVRVVAEYDCADAAIEAGVAERCDLVFLDIQMPGMDGLEAARRWRELPLHVVFVTAYSHHAVDAFDTDAADYLLKPVNAKRLNRALDRARRRLDANPATIEVVDGTSHHRLPVDEIDYIAAAGDYMCLRVGSATVVTRRTLTDLLRELEPHGFMQIHRSTVINRDRIRAVEFAPNGGGIVRLQCGKKLGFSRRYRDVLRERR